MRESLGWSQNETIVNRVRAREYKIGSRIENILSREIFSQFENENSDDAYVAA